MPSGIKSSSSSSQSVSHHYHHLISYICIRKLLVPTQRPHRSHYHVLIESHLPRNPALSGRAGQPTHRTGAQSQPAGWSHRRPRASEQGAGRGEEQARRRAGRREGDDRRADHQGCMSVAFSSRSSPCSSCYRLATALPISRANPAARTTSTANFPSGTSGIVSRPLPLSAVAWLIPTLVFDEARNPATAEKSDTSATAVETLYTVKTQKTDDNLESPWIDGRRVYEI